MHERWGRPLEGTEARWMPPKQTEATVTYQGRKMGTCTSSYLFAKGSHVAGLSVPWVHMGSIGKAWVTVKISKCSIITSLLIILYKLCSNYKVQLANSDKLRNTIFIISLKSVSFWLWVPTHWGGRKFHFINGAFPLPEFYENLRVQVVSENRIIASFVHCGLVTAPFFIVSTCSGHWKSSCSLGFPCHMLSIKVLVESENIGVLAAILRLQATETNSGHSSEEGSTGREQHGEEVIQPRLERIVTKTTLGNLGNLQGAGPFWRARYLRF